MANSSTDSIVARELKITCIPTPFCIYISNGHDFTLAELEIIINDEYKAKINNLASASYPFLSKDIIFYDGFANNSNQTFSLVETKPLNIYFRGYNKNGNLYVKRIDLAQIQKQINNEIKTTLNNIKKQIPFKKIEKLKKLGLEFVETLNE